MLFGFIMFAVIAFVFLVAILDAKIELDAKRQENNKK